MDNINRFKQLFFSIIIPSFNGNERIQKCLNSIFSQNFDKDLYEVIIVDDCSKVPLKEDLKLYNFNEGSNIKIIRTLNNLKPGGARNLGYKIAKGKYILNIDDDDKFTSNSLSSLYKELNTTNLDILLFDSFEISKGQIVGGPHFLSNSTKVQTGEKFILNEQIPWTVWHFAIKNEYIKKNNFRFAEKVLYEDVDFCLEITAKAQSIKYVPLTIIEYTIREGQTSKVNVNVSKMDDMFQTAIRTYNLSNKINNKAINKVFENSAIFQYTVLLDIYLWRLKFKDIIHLINKYQPNSLVNLNSKRHKFFYSQPFIFAIYSYALKFIYKILVKSKNNKIN